MQKIRVAIAGTTQHTVMCADAILTHPDFSVEWVLTPQPKAIGRKQILTKNPLQVWAETKKINVINVLKKIDQEIKEKIQKTEIDLLLVVDFGYLVPQWLLEFPLIGPVNVHPSLLPRWRGSSPGQFVLLYGEKESAVTVMEMGAGMDTGPVITQLPLTVDASWNAAQYYLAAFELVSGQLTTILQHYVAQPEKVIVQPEESPTITARRLSRADGFLPWVVLNAAQARKTPTDTDLAQVGSLFREVQQTTGVTWPQLIRQAVAGLSPWPGVWTLVPGNTGEQRMKILAVSTPTPDKLVIETIQLEGEKPKSYSAFL